MPKVYVSDTETPVYAVYDVKPEGYSTDEIELTDDELTYLRDTEAAAAECDAMIKAKLQGAHGPRTT